MTARGLVTLPVLLLLIVPGCIGEIDEDTDDDVSVTCSACAVKCDQDGTPACSKCKNQKRCP